MTSPCRLHHSPEYKPLGWPLGDPTNTQRIYVGSEASGCVYKSTDGGHSWFSVSDGLENTAVFGLDQDPRRPGLLFVAGPAASSRPRPLASDHQE